MLRLCIIFKNQPYIKCYYSDLKGLLFCQGWMSWNMLILLGNSACNVHFFSYSYFLARSAFKLVFHPRTTCASWNLYLL